MAINPPSKIQALTGIRGIAAVWVVLLHLSPKYEILIPAWKYGDFFISLGGEGVSLFYLLSGYILAYVYKAETFSFSWSHYSTFLRHRIFRIYPVHIATLLFLGVLVLLASARGISLGGAYTEKAFWFNVFLIQKFPFLQEDGWNYPSWTISVEWFSYLFVFPVGCLLVRYRRFFPPLIAVYGLVAASLFFHNDVLFPTTWGPLQGASLFLAGMYLQSYASRRTPSQLRFFGNLATPVFFVCVALFFMRNMVSIVAFELACPIFLLACLSASAPMARFMALGVVVFLGEISYSLYMTHGIVDKLLKIALPPERFVDFPTLVQWGVAGLYTLLIAAAALLCYYLVERPSRRWLRERFG